MILVIDTNILFSMLLAKSLQLRETFFDERKEFYAPNFVMVEIFEKKEKLLKYSKLSETELYELMYRIFDRIKFVMVNKMKRIFLWLISLMLLGSGFAYAANEYTNSAHGDSADGVKYTSRGGPDTSAYATGNCAHCHLYQHQSLNGVASGTALSPQDRADIIPFCLDCHDEIQNDSVEIIWNSVTITDNDIHGDRNITDTVGLEALDGINDGDITNTEGNYTISCIVCHEPHGTSNVMLIREEVNGGSVSGIIPYETTNWEDLCYKCHAGSSNGIHHDSGLYPKVEPNCNCHPGGISSNTINCTECHFHGGTDAYVDTLGDPYTGMTTNRRTF